MIVSVHDWGLLVRLSPLLKAVVPALQLSDVRLKNFRLRFAPGQRVKGRVLDIISEEEQTDRSKSSGAKKVSLTLKKTLVSSTLALITDWSQALPGERRSRKKKNRFF